MKRKYAFTVLSLMLSLVAWAQTGQSNFINYQGVARDGQGQLMADTQMTLQLALRFGSPNDGVAYEENHTVATDANGVFSLQIGSGATTTGNYETLPWGNQAAFISVSLDGTPLGTTEIMAVPYAISSGDAQQTAAEVPYDNAGSGVPVTNTQEALDALFTNGGSGTDDQNLELTDDILRIEGGMGSIDLSNYIDDADADPTNELQDIALDGAILSITNGSSLDLEPLLPPGGSDDQNLELTGDVLNIEGGLGSVNLSNYIDDADADPANELQTLSFDAGTNELSLSNGNSVTIPSGGTDADADPTNELQDIALDGAILSITNGSSLDLEPLLPPGGSDDQNLELTGDVLNIEGGLGSVNLSNYIDDADADPANELQTLSFDAGTNELSLSNGNSVTIPSGGMDADPDPMNEIQDISLDGTELSITNGSTIDLAPLIPPGGTDNQNLELTGDVLTIEDGTGSVDLSTYIDDADADPLNEVDVTAQTGILLGDGTDVTGLIGINDGQVPKWDATTSTWVPGDDEMGTGGASVEELNDLSDAITDTSSLFIGEGAGARNIGSDNTAIGQGALSRTTEGKSNTALGSAALERNTTGFGNTSVGSSALRRNTMGYDNTSVGILALFLNTTGYRNTAMGGFALRSNTTGFENTAVGFSALFANTTGSSNTAIGRSALNNNETGNNNTAIGYRVLAFNSTGVENTALGYEALSSNTSGIRNTAVGGASLTNNTTGDNNTAVGRSTLFENTTGENNTAVGFAALVSNTTGDDNTAFGFDALRSNTTGIANTALGEGAMESNTTGGFNTALGRNAMRDHVSGNNNTALGENAQVPNNTGSNQVRIGNTNISLAQIQVAWTVTSDRRWKSDIRDLPYGLNLVNQLRPVDYVRKNNDNQTRETGFIAQEVETVLKRLGYEDQGILTKDDHGYLSLRYNDFVPILTKALQEQQNRIQKLQAQNGAMLAQLNALEQRFGQLLESKAVSAIKEDRKQPSKK